MKPVLTLIDADTDQYQLATADAVAADQEGQEGVVQGEDDQWYLVDEMGPIATIGDPAILISQQGVYFAELQDAEDEPEVFLVSSQTVIKSIPAEVDISDNSADVSATVTD